MGARFKCKKCQKKFQIEDGRDHIEASIEKCSKITCPLKGRPLVWLPYKKRSDTSAPVKVIDEPVLEVFEEEPIGGFIDKRNFKQYHEKC